MRSEEVEAELLTAGLFDTVKVGDPNPTDADSEALHPCDYGWSEGGLRYICTRSRHQGRQHVAEGNERTGVVAVHPWV